MVGGGLTEPKLAMDNVIVVTVIRKTVLSLKVVEVVNACININRE